MAVKIKQIAADIKTIRRKIFFIILLCCPSQVYLLLQHDIRVPRLSAGQPKLIPFRLLWRHPAIGLRRDKNYTPLPPNLNQYYPLRPFAQVESQRRSRQSFSDGGWLKNLHFCTRSKKYKKRVKTGVKNQNSFKKFKNFPKFSKSLLTLVLQNTYNLFL